MCVCVCVCVIKFAPICTTVQTIGVDKVFFFYSFERSLLCSQRVHLFNKNTVKTGMLFIFMYLKMLYDTIFSK